MGPKEKRRGRGGREVATFFRGGSTTTAVSPAEGTRKKVSTF